MYQFLDQLVRERVQGKYQRMNCEDFPVVCAAFGLVEPEMFQGVEYGPGHGVFIMRPDVFDKLFANLETAFISGKLDERLVSRFSDIEREALENRISYLMYRPEPIVQVPMSEYTDDMWQRALDYFKNRCAYCGAPEGLLRGFQFVREHYIPVSRPDCPGATPNNIVPACHNCNVSKRDKDVVDWLEQQNGKHKTKRIVGKIQHYFELVG